MYCNVIIYLMRLSDFFFMFKVSATLQFIFLF